MFLVIVVLGLLAIYIVYFIIKTKDHQAPRGILKRRVALDKLRLIVDKALNDWLDGSDVLIRIAAYDESARLQINSEFRDIPIAPQSILEFNQEVTAHRKIKHPKC